MKSIISTGALLLAALLPFSTMANTQNDALFSLHNLERERAALLTQLVSVAQDPSQKQLKIQALYRRIADLERMVLRDDRIANSASSVAKKALQQYELTFLIHAATEQNKLPIDHWLQQVGIDTTAVLSAKAGTR
ncbi:MAG: hypothetical protein ACJA13_001090 [Paraglaciecola sp.]|jgi:hypothetical protein